jgi:tetrahydromethanopterin S-methyltransferase subunit H
MKMMKIEDIKTETELMSYLLHSIAEMNKVLFITRVWYKKYAIAEFEDRLIEDRHKCEDALIKLMSKVNDKLTELRNTKGG